MRTKKLEVIKCPKCGYEYLPCEIYLPNAFLGKASSIVRDDKGAVNVYDGKSMDLNETYICDKCNTKFSVTAKVSFKTEPVVDEFDEEYSTEIDSKITFNEV